MSYAPDPGGVFESDVHRRVLGHLPVPGTDAHDLNTVAGRIGVDPHTPIDADDVDDLEDVLKDVEADGYATKSGNGWKMTKKGLDALNAPPQEG